MEILSNAAITAIVARVEPSAEIVAAAPLTGGLSSWMTVVEVERVGGARHRLVVRRGRRPDSERHTLPFATEFELLRHLAANDIPVPRPRAFDGSRRIIPQAYIVLDHAPGTTRFTADDPVALAVEMADVLAAIHSLDAAGASVPPLPRHVDRIDGWIISDLTRRPPDPTLREGLVRRHLDEHWPPPTAEACILHADYFPGNIVWDGRSIAAVIDWESAAIGDPMADIATTRLDLRWVFGEEVEEIFTERYLTTTGRSPATLPVWELVVSLRPAGAVSLWASDMLAHGRPDITADAMRAEQHAFVDRALDRLLPPSERSPGQ